MFRNVMPKGDWSAMGAPVEHANYGRPGAILLDAREREARNRDLGATREAGAGALNAATVLTQL